MTADLVLSLKNDPAEIARLAPLVAAFCARHALAEATAAQLTLVLDEAITNIISYAYDDAGEHEISVRISLAPGTLIAELVDDGREFDPLQVAAPDLAAPLVERAVGGLGVHLMRRLMDDIRYRREGARNHLVLAKRIA
jgi:serine/threonine-protein kinase RsbW/sigma-B regulation protein RsbU (phosphoserine phosphatase)